MEAIQDIAASRARTEVCKLHGEFVSVLRSFCGMDEWTQCPSCSDDAEQRSREYESQMRREREQRQRQALLQRANIPRRYHESELDSYHSESEGQHIALRASREYVDHFAEHLKAGRCLLFLGKPGTGKTHLACAIALALTARNYHVRYYTIADLIRELRDTWRKDSSCSEVDFMRSVMKPDLMVLDEVGVQFGTDAELVHLTEIIDKRYREQKPTLIVSNCDKVGLIRFLGERAVDRLRENGGQLVTFDWESYRRKTAKSGGAE